MGWCKKRSNVRRKRSAACEANCKGECEDERGKDNNVSNLEEGFGRSLSGLFGIFPSI